MDFDSPSSDLPMFPEFKLDTKQAQGFISFFKTLPSDGRAVRIFDRKEYYTAHGENAFFIANTYSHTSTALWRLGEGLDAIFSMSISKDMFKTITRDILLYRTDHTLEVYDGSGSKWRLIKSGTPGNFDSFEDVLFANNDMTDLPVTIALLPRFHVSQCTVGLAFVDLTKHELGIAEFLDDSRFTNIESICVALGCKECVLPARNVNLIEMKPIIDVLTRCCVFVTERKKSEFKQRDLVQGLGKILRCSVEPVQILHTNLSLALDALGALLSYVGLLSEDSEHGKFTFTLYNLDRYMRLDSAAIKALNVLENNTDANKNFSLFELMNRTCTAGMGQRLLNRWLRQPLLDVKEINGRLDFVQACVDDMELRQGLRHLLKSIPDMESLTHKLKPKTTTLHAVVKLYQSVVRLPHIIVVIERYEGQFSQLLREKYLDVLEYLMDTDQLKKFIGLVESAVNLKPVENGEYMISTCYDFDLFTLKEKLNEVEQKFSILQKHTAEELNLPSVNALKVEKRAQYGHVFSLTKKKLQKVRIEIAAGFIVLETRKDGIKFTNSKLKNLADEYKGIFSEYRRCQKTLVTRVVDTAASFTELFEIYINVLSELDVLLSFADLATSCPVPYVRPYLTTSDRGDIILEGCRHPCVEAQNGVSFISNDCSLVRGKSWLQIITGPNMGGKSTFIRQVGVNVLMAQVGCFIPCDRAAISVRDCIFTRVGADDCQLLGVSTFMREMLETASILKGSTEKSLVIIDELGRGTSTYDGFGLAWAVSKHLAEFTRAPTLFATHFTELTSLSHEGVANYHLGAHIDSSTHKLTMLYKVKPGACDQSFGIHVAECANFPEEVVALARAKAAELEDISVKYSVSNKVEYESRPSKMGKTTFSTDDITKGVARAHRFLEDFTNLPIDELPSMDVQQCFRKLVSDLENDAANDCLWLQQFF